MDAGGLGVGAPGAICSTAGDGREVEAAAPRSVVAAAGCVGGTVHGAMGLTLEGDAAVASPSGSHVARSAVRVW